MKVKIKKLHNSAVIPKKVHDQDAGFDLTAISKDTVDEEDYEFQEYDTGIALEIPRGYVGLVYPRSSISKTGHILANSTGIIDSNYRGSIKVRFKTIPDYTEYIPGDRIAQLIIMPYPEIEFEETDSLEDSERASGAFGSTGK